MGYLLWILHGVTCFWNIYMAFICGNMLYGVTCCITILYRSWLQCPRTTPKEALCEGPFGWTPPFYPVKKKKKYQGPVWSQYNLDFCDIWSSFGGPDQMLHRMSGKKAYIFPGLNWHQTRPKYLLANSLYWTLPGLFSARRCQQTPKSCWKIQQYQKSLASLEGISDKIPSGFANCCASKIKVGQMDILAWKRSRRFRAFGSKKKCWPLGEPGPYYSGVYGVSGIWVRIGWGFHFWNQNQGGKNGRHWLSSPACDIGILHMSKRQAWISSYPTVKFWYTLGHCG